MNIIEVNHQKAKILLEDSENRIFLNHVPLTPLHNHLYCEIHILTEGDADFTVDGTNYQIKKNNVILIPALCYHTVSAKKTPTSRIIFYAECATNDVICKHIAADFIDELHQKVQEQSDVSLVYNHLVFILNELISLKELRAYPLNDYRLQIREFFSLNYNKKITLSDLAERLHLSTMQTQRVIKKHTGKTFGENLLTQRMTVAENLMKTTDMSLSEIAEYVGYESYCGFWKARRQFAELENIMPPSPGRK